MRPTSVVSGIAVAGLTLGFLLVPSGSARAQSAERSVQPDVEDAKRLYREAQRVEAADDRSTQLTAAWLYREAARLWPEGAEKRYRSLWRAAHLYVHHGHAAEAAALLAEAGRQARENGRLERAATCYLRLARLAAEAGEERSARSALEKVGPLLEKAALDSPEREQLRTMAANVRTMITELAESS